MDIVTGHVGSAHVTSWQDRDLNQGIFGPDTYILNVGSKLAATIISEIPVCAGYTFLGWNEVSTSTVAAYQGGSPFYDNRNTDFYAIWAPDSYTVTYHANGGSGSSPAPAKHPAGNAVTVENAQLTKTNYQFVGWSTSSGSSTVDNPIGSTFKMPNHDVDLYAVYMPTEIPYNGTDGTDGSIQSFTAPVAGTYQIQLWGAKGGRSCSEGTVNQNRPSGGYTVLNVTLTKGQTIYFAVGGHGADVVDINFGCPVSKIAGRGAGSGMMREPDKMVAITRAIVEAIPDKPVTVKTRLGWDESSKIIVELAERLQDCGIKALTIHGRTRCQMYKGSADWTLIGEVKRNPRMHIPIIGNGDIVDGPSAKRAFDDYGVDGIMIARASFGRPWIFREIKQYLAAAGDGTPLGSPLPGAAEPFEIGVKERVAIARRHLALSLAEKGEPRGIFEMRRHLSCYFKGLPEFKDTRIRMVTTLDADELYRILDYIEERWG